MSPTCMLEPPGILTTTWPGYTDNVLQPATSMIRVLHDCEAVVDVGRSSNGLAGGHNTSVQPHGCVLRGQSQDIDVGYEAVYALPR